MADLRSARQKTKKQSLGVLAKVKERQANGAVQRTTSLAALKARKRGRPALSKFKQRRRSPDDFAIAGILYHNPKVTDYRGDSPLGSVDVTNGSMTYRFTNTAGSWMHPIPGQRGHYKEPAALGLGGQLEVCTNLNVRFASHLKREGILTAAQKRVQRDMQAKAERQRKRQPSSLAALKARKQQD